MHAGYNLIIGTGLKCYSCHDSLEHPDETCTISITGREVTCQTDNPEMPNFGDSCYVGHSGKYFGLI